MEYSEDVMEDKFAISNLKTIHVGDSVVVQGKVAPGAKRFAINLGQDASNYLIHFNPRFDENNVIVYNFKKDGKWGPEQRDDQFSFMWGEETTVAFALNSGEVTVNYPGGHFEFKSQLNLDCVEYISVKGDFEVQSINIK
ncbi:16 kDa beta-galactoside-binding lectin-like [Eublepharis macularius]|uniref:Galectin n=1 Tax=Eublepharis macularius TaxID=481883 RepID=A0AA97J3H0_EUBMA|nr:16 kDa beta-galactoside-binding lectin-like [Eublepharis macularius]